jgi:uncharacterized protein YkwD
MRTQFPIPTRCAACALVVVLCLSALSGCGLPGDDGDGGRDSSVRGVSVRPERSDRDAAEAFQLVNEERSLRGMRTLRRRTDLDAIAYAHARDLMRMNRLDHISSDGRQLEHRLANLDWEWAGENLARNKGYASPSAEAVKGWIASPRHYENMFRPDYSQSGMAALFDPDSGFTYFVQVFIIPAS